MKDNVNPAVGVVLVVLVVLFAGYFLWHASIDKPDYPGANAGHPSAESGGPGASLSGPITRENVDRMHIPGRTPNRANMSGTNGTATHP